MKVRSLFCIATTILGLVAPTVSIRANELQRSGSNAPASFSVSAAPADPFQHQDQVDPLPLVNVQSGTYAQAPIFETTASILFLQPSSGSLEYGTLVYPLPAPTPHWENQSINPDFAPAFNLGVRFMIPETSNDIRASWTHLNSSDSASFTGGAQNFAGPQYLIGPGSTAYNDGAGTVKFNYEAVNLEFGHLMRTSGPFQMRVHGGMQYGRVKQNLSSFFRSTAGDYTHSNSTLSNFNGAGPRIGVNGEFNRGNFQFFGDMAAFALIGRNSTRMDFATTFPAIGSIPNPFTPSGNPPINLPGIPQPNQQSFTSPNATQVVPGLDCRMGAAYSRPLGIGILRLEAGYQAVVYVNAVNSYNLTQVAVPPNVSAIGVFMATQEHVQSTFTAHGPFASASFAF